MNLKITKIHYIAINKTENTLEYSEIVTNQPQIVSYKLCQNFRHIGLVYQKILTIYRY